jgi:hypothetical protein
MYATKYNYMNITDLFLTKKAATRRALAVIEKIHNEFDTASNILLAEAYNILQKQIPHSNKAELLQSIGFKNSREVLEYNKRMKELNDAALLSLNILLYKQKYPRNKFITKDQVGKIAAKYNLCIGTISSYTGFVPEKNAREIATFYCDKFDRLGWNEEERIIIAPKHDFNTDGKIWAGRWLIDAPTGPIVLQPVNDGYLIITKWGLEASDPIVND